MRGDEEGCLTICGLCGVNFINGQYDKLIQALYWNKYSNVVWCKCRYCAYVFACLSC